MKNFAVHSGSWSKKGNFTGKNAKGLKVFVSNASMISLGFAEGKAITPFYAIADDVEIGILALDATGVPILDDKGQPTFLKDKETNEPVTTTRFEALSVFANKQSLLDAQADDATLDAEVAKAVNDAVASIGGMSMATQLASANV
jgi:hypothetical protein